MQKVIQQQKRNACAKSQHKMGSGIPSTWKFSFSKKSTPYIFFIIFLGVTGLDFKINGKGKVCVPAKWPIRPEIIPVSVA